MLFCKCVCGCVPEWVCLRVCVCCDWYFWFNWIWFAAIVIQHPCHSTTCAPYSCTIIVAAKQSLSQCDGNGNDNNNNNNERRSVRTLTAAAATYTPEFSVTKPKLALVALAAFAGTADGDGICWLYFDFILNARLARRSLRHCLRVGQGGRKGTGGGTFSMSVNSWRCII